MSARYSLLNLVLLNYTIYHGLQNLDFNIYQIGKRNSKPPKHTWTAKSEKIRIPLFIHLYYYLNYLYIILFIHFYYTFIHLYIYVFLNTDAGRF